MTKAQHLQRKLARKGKAERKALDGAAIVKKGSKQC